MSEWKDNVELLADREHVKLERWKVDGGYIYRSCSMVRGDGISEAMVFVPDIDITRYQSHLRDAYNQGLKDGIEQERQNTKNAYKAGYGAGHYDGRNGIKEAEENLAIV